MNKSFTGYKYFALGMIFSFFVLCGGENSYAIPIPNETEKAMVEQLYNLADEAIGMRIINALRSALCLDTSVEYIKNEIKKNAGSMTSDLYQQFEDQIGEISKDKNEGLFHLVNDGIFTLGIAFTTVLASRFFYARIKNAYWGGFDISPHSNFTYAENKSSRPVKLGAWLLGISGGAERNAKQQKAIIGSVIKSVDDQGVAETRLFY